MEEDQKVMKGVKEIQETWNLSEDERAALQGIRRDNSVVIKPADKGSVVVIMDREQYIREAMRQLQNEEFYRELREPMYPESTGVIKVELERLRREGFINKKQLEYLKGQGTPKERRFYLLPKIHKPKGAWPFPDVPPIVGARAMGWQSS